MRIADVGGLTQRKTSTKLMVPKKKLSMLQSRNLRSFCQKLRFLLSLLVLLGLVFSEALAFAGVLPLVDVGRAAKAALAGALAIAIAMA